VGHVGLTVEIVLGGTDVRDDGALSRSGAFAALYEQWYPPLVNLCRRTGCGDDAPEDVAQEAFMKAWAAWDSYRVNRPFWPWVATIAHRLCIDHWRRMARSKGGVELLEREHVAPPDELVEGLEEQQLVGRAFNRLRPFDRRILGLREIEGWTYSEIAEFEDVSLESVRASLHRAREASGG